MEDITPDQHWQFFAELAAESPDMARAVVRALREAHERGVPVWAARPLVERECGHVRNKQHAAQ